MPIELRQINGGTGPFVVCVYCGEPITKSSNVLWRRSADFLSVEAGPEFSHKECERANEERSRREWPSSEELDAWLLYLVHNAQVDLEAAHERVTWLDRDTD